MCEVVQLINRESTKSILRKCSCVLSANFGAKKIRLTEVQIVGVNWCKKKQYCGSKLLFQKVQKLMV